MFKSHHLHFHRTQKINCLTFFFITVFNQFTVLPHRYINTANNKVITDFFSFFFYFISAILPLWSSHQVNLFHAGVFWGGLIHTGNKRPNALCWPACFCHDILIGCTTWYEMMKLLLRVITLSFRGGLTFEFQIVFLLYQTFHFLFICSTCI